MYCRMKIKGELNILDTLIPTKDSGRISEYEGNLNFYQDGSFSVSLSNGTIRGKIERDRLISYEILGNDRDIRDIEKQIMQETITEFLEKCEPPIHSYVGNYQKEQLCK